MNNLLLFLLDGSHSAVPGPHEVGVEEVVVNCVLWLKLAVEAIGALVIGIGVVVAAYQYLRAPRTSEHAGHNLVRLTLARYLALGLELQLGADILSTAVAPTWDQIGKLGAIAVIRTALNHFLMREMHEEHERGAEDVPHASTTSPPKA